MSMVSGLSYFCLILLVATAAAGGFTKRIKPKPGAPEQVKLSLGLPDEMVVSWISHDAIPMDGTCFVPNLPRLDSSDASLGPGSPFPYAMHQECEIAHSEVIWTDIQTHKVKTSRHGPQNSETSKQSTHSSLLPS